MTHVADKAHEGNPNTKSRRRARLHFPSTWILDYELHLASIRRDDFETIADQPIFDDHQRATGSRPITWRIHLEPDGPPHDKRKRITFSAGLLDRVVTALRGQGIDVRGDEQEQRRQRAHRRLRSLHLLPQLEERIYFIAELCKLASETHVLVVVKNDSEARMVAGMLAQATGRRRYGNPISRAAGPGSWSKACAP